jgi:hypothetical protein
MDASDGRGMDAVVQRLRELYREFVLAMRVTA